MIVGLMYLRVTAMSERWIIWRQKLPIRDTSGGYVNFRLREQSLVERILPELSELSEDDGYISFLSTKGWAYDFTREDVYVYGTYDAALIATQHYKDEYGFTYGVDIHPDDRYV